MSNFDWKICMSDYGKTALPTTSSREALQALTAYINKLSVDLNELTRIFCDANQSLQQIALEEFEDELLKTIHETFNRATDSLEFQVCQEKLTGFGSVTFAKKLLWSESIDDIGWIIAIDRLVPKLDNLVNTHPMILLDQARNILHELMRK